MDSETFSEENLMSSEADPDLGFIDTGVNFLSSNGWFISLGILILYVIYTKYGSHFERLRQQQPQQRQYHDPSVVVQRQVEMDAARRRMQAQQDALAEQHKAKQKELEEQKRQEKISNWEQLQQGLGSKLGTSRQEEPVPTSNLTRRPKGSQSSSSSERLRGGDYNPLMGSSGGSSYRPERRGTSQGG
ncbi:selenoprotein S [Ixodes scapularis]|uniref:selenoprotein S n=1 Tax=Ixodes scapularis TaxID=6945 RepID=UPI001C383860|nr:selenoprotein S [Ixodes scapularis]